MYAVGENLPATIRGDTTILEHMTENNLLNDFYQQGLGIPRANEHMARMVKQIANRYPHMDILEIGKLNMTSIKKSRLIFDI
jgi:hybrid polyketide synthase/nonribosomal peptide synthetase ACE1